MRMSNKMDRSTSLVMVLFLAVVFFGSVLTENALGQITSYPYTEGFESGFGDWINVAGDDIDWTRHSGSTPSSPTGPSSAYQGTYYLYVESSDPAYPDKTAILEGPSFDLTPLSNPALLLWYHMYGSAMGTLSLEVSDDDGANWATEWSLSADQGDVWHKAFIDLSAYNGIIKIRFTGITGSNYRSDMAIDYIELAEAIHISGYVRDVGETGVEGVLVEANTGGSSDTTDIDGYYELAVPDQWSGTITPSKTYYSFVPALRIYDNVSADQYDQDYTGYLIRISGHVHNVEETGVEGVLVEANNGGGSDTTDVDGYYDLAVPGQWSGTVTPTKTARFFEPRNQTYDNVTADQVDQDYAAHHITSPVYVDDNATDDPGPGDPDVSDSLENGSAEHPFDAIQEAIDVADDNYTIIVLTGTYTGNGNRDIEFRGKAITVRGTNPDNWTIVEATIIDCQGSYSDPHRGFYFHDNETDNSTLSGLTITNGYVTYASPGYSDGGGISCSNSSPTISNCTISNNVSSGGSGGGVYCHDSSPTITNCLISNNQVYGRGTFTLGGGVGCSGGSNLTITSCVISGNSGHAGAGVGMYSGNITMANCMISRNQAWYEGGGVFVWGNGSFTITNSTISGNRVDRDGGGVYCQSDGSLAITNCTISGNHAGYDGGGIYCRDNSSITVANCTITGNIAEENGAALAASYSYVLDLPSVVDITNSIFWNGEDQIWNNDNSTITITYSDVQGGWEGLGNMGVDPLFADPGYWDDNDTPGDELDDFWVDGDYHLKSQGGRWDAMAGDWTYDNVTSRGIDAGNPGCDPADEWPFEGNRINMGAYGGTDQASIPGHNWANIADINNDRIVNWGDFGVFAGYWLEEGLCIPADLNRSSTVNWGDFSIFAANWLWTH